MAKLGKSEFGGGSGLIQPEQLESLTTEQEVQMIYATNPDSSAAPDASRVGDPRSYKNYAEAVEPNIPDRPEDVGLQV